MQCCRRCEEDHYCYFQYNQHYHHSRQCYYVCNFSFILMITVNYHHSPFGDDDDDDDATAVNIVVYNHH